MKKYRNTIEFEVYGSYALFSNPVMRVGGEKTSYHIPTYEALKGIVERLRSMSPLYEDFIKKEEKKHVQ